MDINVSWLAYMQVSLGIARQLCIGATAHPTASGKSKICIGQQRDEECFEAFFLRTAFSHISDIY